MNRFELSVLILGSQIMPQIPALLAYPSGRPICSPPIMPPTPIFSLASSSNAGIWGLIWDPKINTESSKRFIQGVIDKYNHTPTSRCYLGYAAMMQILEAVRRAGTTDTAAVIKALEGHDFDGLKEGRSYFRAWDHQHVQDVLVGQAYGKELGLGHYQILATVPGDAVAGGLEQNTCRL